MSPVQSGNVKALLHGAIASSPAPARWRLCLIAALFGSLVFSASGAITSLYAFGDGVSTTTNNTDPAVASLYYGHRFCNGRVWIEVLSQRQGIAYNANKNWSYFGHYSSDLLANLNRFPAPGDAGTSLFMVWVSDADFVYDLNTIDPPYTSASLPAWTAAINQSLNNHRQAIQALYNKGARKLIVPNGVNIANVPYFAYLSASDKAFVRQRVLEFNSGFATILDQGAATWPGLVLYRPDFFTLFDKMIARPADYGLTKTGIDAIDDPALVDTSLNGPGANYLFWDYMHPTAKAQMIMAEICQQMVSPVRIAGITAYTGSNRLDLADVPVGRNGVIQSSGDFLSWTNARSFPSTNVAETIFAPASGPRQFLRLSFPFAWSWP